MTKEEAIRRIRAWNLDPDDMEALSVVVPELTDSEDERIRKAISAAICGTTAISILEANGTNLSDALSYLEKQKDIWGERAQYITANMLEDGIEGVQRELIEFLSNTVNASWVDIILLADVYAERIRNIIEKQKEQKHPRGCFTCDEYKKGYEAGRLNGFTAGYNKAIKEQKPVEWSEEDEKMFARIIERGQSQIQMFETGLLPEHIAWLKAFRKRFTKENEK